MTDHLLISLEFSLFFISFFIRWSVDDRSPIDFVEFSFFISLFLYSLFFIRWSVDDRSPIDFVRIFFLYFFLYLLGGLSMTDHLLISLEFSFYFYYYLFLFLPYTFLCTRLLDIDKVNFLWISVSHQALWFQV